MKKTSGQALIEFILILPVFLLLVFGSIEFGKIIYEKYQLQNDLDTVKMLYTQKRTQELEQYLQNKNLIISYEQKGDYTILTITKMIKVITPGLNQILKSPYPVKESVTLLNETQS